MRKTARLSVFAVCRRADGAHLWSDGCCKSCLQSISQLVPPAELNRPCPSLMRRAKWMPPWPSSNHLIVLCGDMSRKDSCRGAPLMCHLFCCHMTIAVGGGGGREEGIIWFHLHLFTWTPWANGNHFHFKTEKGVKRFGSRN